MYSVSLGMNLHAALLYYNMGLSRFQSLSLQRRMAENMAIARAREEAVSFSTHFPVSVIAFFLLFIIS